MASSVLSPMNHSGLGGSVHEFKNPHSAEKPSYSPPSLPTEMELFPELKGRFKDKHDQKDKRPVVDKVVSKLFSPIPSDEAEFKESRKITDRDQMRTQRGRMIGMNKAEQMGNSTYCSIRATGPKPIDEDRFDNSLLQFRDKNGERASVQYHGVFDGHGGSETSNFLKKKMSRILKSKLKKIDLKSPVQIKQALKAAFIEANAKFKEQGGRNSVGATSLVAVVIEGSLYVANAGDGRAVLGNGSQAIQMSQDAGATDEPFLSSLKKRGYDGQFIFQRTPSSYPEASAKDPRKEGINPSLVVSRVFAPNGPGGKMAPSVMPARVIGDLELSGVSCRPKVKAFNLSELDSKQDNYLIMGTDGLWDTIDSQEAVDIAQAKGAPRQSDSDKVNSVTQELLREAYSWGSIDNTTVSVIKF